jgi:alkyl sulfatase BDS1-like metallo-beta-lactamase superfamily hydrolase
MGTIADLAERMWAGELDVVHEHHPVAARYPEAEEIVDGVLVYLSTASANTLDTGDGLVMLDTGAPYDVDALYGQVRRWRPDEPLAAAVYSHHHIDHVFGTARFEQEAAERGRPRPVVYAHADLPGNFDRYLRTLGWNLRINQRQFGLYGLANFTWPDRYRYPDVTFDDRLTFRRGELTFELHHDRGETDDATWTWVPERKVLHPGDLFIYAVPNAGNPQKVQRYVGDWAAGLRKMAALGAEVMISGHGLPVLGGERIRTALTDTAELLESLESQTLALMETGCTLDRVLHDVELPAHLRGKPYLQPVYDHPQFIVRNVWRRFGGWHDGEPDHLLPSPRQEQAREWIALAGGTGAVLARAAELREGGNLRLACHLVEHAVVAEPASADVHALRAELYTAWAAEQSSSMARNILDHAAESSRQGKRDLAGDF